MFSMLLYLDWDTHQTCLVGLYRGLLGVLPDVTLLSIFSSKSLFINVINVNGELMNKQTDQGMDFHIYVIFDILANWRKGKELTQDTSLPTC